MSLACAILDDYQGVALGLADWSALGDRVHVEVLREPLADDARAERLAPYHIVVAMRERTPFDAALVGALPNLRLIVTTGMLNAAIDMGAAADRGVTVCGTRSLATPTPEHAWALLMALCRNIPAEERALRAGRWQQTIGRDLAGATLGLVGFGKVAKVMARYAAAFEMRVVAFSRSLTDDVAAEHGVRRAASLDELLAAADIVSVHVPLTDATRGLIGADALSRMRRGALLLNTSRGPIVDSDALAVALADGRLGGAAVDVFDHEPIRGDEALLAAPNTVLTPHLGYVTKANYARYYADAVEDIAAYLDGTPVRVLAAPQRVHP
ncbi:D-2-hydroxyacid dehydrogenase family protein [Acuticoccus mangrovi]|uniref:D-2-hydroxyacid dehydrogenase family protein n=1 Tax=Acuticoccus mangrovi TaxID=2796142 RepID=A0A934MGW9_9HYPH|nr:D-2-hydroxyacid dehydrogenase family protein [Acuticoccus mangrovi]MBJ3777043.1 D-2-hydroxyacid dehydrogenase family protein [Acuticoccus mangrovi]